MANTKLSNTYDLDRIVKSIPSQIESYTKDVREDVVRTKEKSLYYSEMSFVGMFTCVLLCVIGTSIIVIPDVIFGYLSIDKDILTTYNALIKIGGILLLLVGIHGIGKMLFARKVSVCDKGVSKIEESFKKQLDTSLKKYSVNHMIDMIEQNKDEELPETDSLDNKLVNSVEALLSRNKLMNKLTLISRIVLPIVVYAITMFAVFKSDRLDVWGITIAFVLMIIFSRRLCLLLEYKVGKAIRAIMTIPALVYGFVLYFRSKSVFEGMCFLPYNLQVKLPEAVRPFVSSIFIICLLQVVALVLSVLFQDYYSEKKRLLEGIGKNEKEEPKHRKWYIYYSIAMHVFLFAAYIIAMNVEMKEWQNLNSVGNTLLLGVIFGVTWRIISPIWPEAISKSIREFWGVKYSIIVSSFVFVIIATLFFLNGFVFTGYALTALIAMIVSSWIAFAVMVHFWG